MRAFRYATHNFVAYLRHAVSIASSLPAIAWLATKYDAYGTIFASLHILIFVFYGAAVYVPTASPCIFAFFNFCILRQSRTRAYGITLHICMF